MTENGDAARRPRPSLGRLMVRPFASVRVAIVFWVLVVIFISLFLSTWHTIQGQRDRLYDELFTRADIVADSYARALSRPVWDIDQPAARNTVESIYVSDDAVVGAWLYDDHFGEVTAAFGPMAETEETGEHHTLVTRDITFPEADAPLGELFITYSHESVEAYVRDAWIAGLVKFLLVAGVMSAVLLYLLSRLSSPLIHLTGALNQLAEGQLDTEIAYEHRNDEIGRMARACRAFRDSLEEKIRVEQEARAFEKRKAEERTAELEALAQYIEATFSGTADDLDKRGRQLTSAMEAFEQRGELDAETAAELRKAGERLVKDGQEFSSELGYILDMLRGS